MKTRFNHNPNGNDVADELVSIGGVGQAWDFLHDNIMQEKGISIYSGPNKSGQKITDYTIVQDPAKPWKYSISFGGTVQPGDYYVSYSSLGDQVDANDINDLETGLASKADVGHKHVLSDITDIDVTGEQDGYALVYDAASDTYMFKQITGSGGATALSQLSDIDLTGNADGDILVFDQATNKFKVSTPPTGETDGKIVQSFSGNSSQQYTFNQAVFKVSISNGGAQDLTFTIGDISIIVKVGEVFTDIFDPFTKIYISATDSYLLYGEIMV